MEVKTLGELCNIVSGGTPSRSKAEFWNEGTIPWIKIGNIKGKYINEADEFITQAGLDGSSAKLLSKGTVLYTIFATLGEVGVLQIDACTNQAIAGLTIKNEKQLDTDYLYYYLKSKKSYVNNVGRGVAQNNINMSILRSFELPLPELSKQKGIVSVLDKVSGIIEARQQELQKLDELIKARFVEMFGDINKPKWETKSFENEVYFQEGPGVRNWQFRDSGIKLINIKNIVGDKLCLENTDKYLEIDEVNQKYKHFLLNAGDYVMASSGVTWGKIAEVYDEHLPLCLNTSIIRLVPKNKIEKKYLFHFIKSNGFRMQIKRLITGSAQPNFGPSHLKQIAIPVPPKELQEQFEKFVKQVDKSKFVGMIA